MIEIYKIYITAFSLSKHLHYYLSTYPFMLRKGAGTPWVGNNIEREVIVHTVEAYTYGWVGLALPPPQLYTVCSRSRDPF